MYLLTYSQLVCALFRSVYLRKKKKWISWESFCNAEIENLRSLGKRLDTLLTDYEKVFLLGDFNADG